MTFVPVRVVDVGGRASLAWTEGLSFKLPADLVQRAGLASRIGPDGDLSLRAEIGGVTAADARDLRLRAAFTDTPLASSRLPVSYQRVPGWMRAAIASAVGRRQRRRVARWAAFPGWPLDLSADFVADLAGMPRAMSDGPTPVVLTHDIDSPEGLRNLVRDFLPQEETAGARSTNYVVPCAWAPDDAALEEAAARGHEIGVHGYDHSNRTPFADADERGRRLDAARRFATRYHAVGYRAPSLLRTRALLRDLASRYAYDSSIPTSGGLFPVPNNGCATARPFRIDGIVELPLSMPRDGSLRFLGHDPREIADLWIRCADAISHAGGIVVLLTHCEGRFSGTAPMRAAYQRFLDHVASESSRFAFSTAAALLPRFEHVDAI